MTDAEQISRVISDGGFRIDIRPDELTVTPDAKAWRKRKRTGWRMVLRILLFGIVGLVLLAEIAISDKPLLILLLLAVVFGLSYLMPMFIGKKALHCTRNSIEVVNLVRGVERSRRSYPKAEVGQIRYSAVSYSKYGAVNGIVFEAAQKKVKSLSGLECPEAQIILKEFDRLGFKVFHDVGMPMLVEMALERRNSWINAR